MSMYIVVCIESMKTGIRSSSVKSQFHMKNSIKIKSQSSSVRSRSSPRRLFLHTVEWKGKFLIMKQANTYTHTYTTYLHGGSFLKLQKTTLKNCNYARGKSLLESWGTTFLPDWQPPLIFVWFTSKSHAILSIEAHAQEVWDKSDKD